MTKNFEVALTKELCIICGKKMDGAIVMNQFLTEKAADSVKQLHNQVVGFADKPCDSCQENLDKSFLFISYDEELSDMDNLPEGFYRTGHIRGVKKDCDLVHQLEENGAIKGNLGYLFTPHSYLIKWGLINENK